MLALGVCNKLGNSYMSDILNLKNSLSSQNPNWGELMAPTVL